MNFRNDDLVSVIVPTYNRAGFIIKSLDTIWGQTYRPIEVLVIDDGSKDNTKELVEKWGRNLDSQKFRIKYVYQDSAGVSAARNTGIAGANGRYLQFLDSDDLLMPEKLELQIGKLKQEDTPICICNYDHIGDKEKIILKINNKRSFKEILESPVGLHTSIGVIDRQKFDKGVLKWNPKLKVSEDKDFYHKLFLVTKNFSIVERPLFKYIHHDSPHLLDSTSHSKKSYLKCLWSLLRFRLKHHKKIQDYKRPHINKLCWGYLRRHFGIGRYIPEFIKLWK